MIFFQHIARLGFPPYRALVTPWSALTGWMGQYVVRGTYPHGQGTMAVSQAAVWTHWPHCDHVNSTVWGARRGPERSRQLGQASDR